jgi:hypothetical protein
MQRECEAAHADMVKAVEASRGLIELARSHIDSTVARLGRAQGSRPGPGSPN